MQEFDKWKFVSRWEFLSWKRKNKLYNDFACHELNLFIFFRDNEYFMKVIRPFLRNKIEKTFVDYFLLEDEKNLTNFSSLVGL